LDDVNEPEKSGNEKMLAGELYDALHPELTRERARCRDLCKLLNDPGEEQQDERRRILADLFGSDTDDTVQPPFYCYYGTNIRLGRKVYFQFQLRHPRRRYC
jgi:maltose O-acetyltransferase